MEIVLAADQSWVATLAGNRREGRVTDRTCIGFRDAIAAYSRLPPLRPAPVLLIPDRPRNLPLAPRAPHAEYWVITTAGYAPDWSQVDLEIRGSQGPYAHWVNDTVEAIKSCAPSAP
ncbi:MAG: hypothetical protein WC555_09880 [Brevundimonas sp.]